MKQKETISGTYSINNQEPQDFQLEFEDTKENTEQRVKLFELLNQPIKLIKDGGKYGIKGVKRFFSILFLFWFTNTILFFYAVSRVFTNGFDVEKLGFIFLVFIIGLASTVLAGYKTYQYVVIDAFRVIYENLNSLFKKISDTIVDRVEELLKNNEDSDKTKFAQVLDVSNLINAKYKNIPPILRRGLLFVLKRIPLVGMVAEIKSEVIKGNKTEASTKLYGKIDTFISENIFGNNNTKWVWWALPLNIIAILLLISFKIG